MKKIAFLFLFSLIQNPFFSEQVSETEKVVLNFGMDINIVKEKLGSPLEYSLVHEYINPNYNEYLIKYDDLTIHYEIGDETISFILSNSFKHSIKIDGREVYCGKTKAEIEEMFGKLFFDFSYNGNDIYSYYADNFTVVFFTFDKNGVLFTIQQEHE